MELALPETNLRFDETADIPPAPPDRLPVEPQTFSPPTDPHELAGAIRDAHAANLRDLTAAGYLYGSMTGTIGEGIGGEAYLEYRNRLLRDCGEPTNPIEIMLIEQLALAHHNIGRLYCRSSVTKDHIASVAYAAAAARLVAEFRRTALALEEYRTRVATRTGVLVDAKPIDADGDGDDSVAAGGEVAIPLEKAKKNGRHGRKNEAANKVRSRELPQCLKDRIEAAIPAASQPAAGIG